MGLGGLKDDELGYTWNFNPILVSQEIEGRELEEVKSEGKEMVNKEEGKIEEIRKGYDEIYELLSKLISHFSFVRAYGRVAGKWLYSENDQKEFEENVEEIEKIFKRIERICLDYLIWK